MYRAAPAEALRIVPLDDISAVYHRASGITHLVASPVPEILATLGPGGATLPDLIARLGERYDLLDCDAAALGARLGELVESGLVRTA